MIETLTSEIIKEFPLVTVTVICGFFLAKQYFNLSKTITELATKVEVLTASIESLNQAVERLLKVTQDHREDITKLNHWVLIHDSKKGFNEASTLKIGDEPR